MTYGVINKINRYIDTYIRHRNYVMITMNFNTDLLSINDLKLDVVDVPDRYLIRKWVGRTLFFIIMARLYLG